MAGGLVRVDSVGEVAGVRADAGGHVFGRGGRSGQSQACLRAVGHCDEHFSGRPADGQHDATWGYYADEGQILGDAGHALFDLAMATGEKDHATMTITRLEKAYATHPPEASRSRALTMIRIACMKVRHQDLADGCHAAELGVADARDVRSRRVWDDLRQLDTVLAKAYDADGLRDRIEQVRTDIRALTCLDV